MTVDDKLAALGEAEGGARAPGAPVWSPATLPWRLVEVAAAGALAGVLMILVWLNLRPDLAEAIATPFFWIKAAFPLAIAVCALVSATRLTRGEPGGDSALAVAGALAAAMLLAAGIDAWAKGPAELWTLYWPNAGVCLGNILVIAAPMLVLTTASLRDVELERPASAGLACGLFCGGVAATVNGLHCWQTTYAFVGPWFTSAVLICGVVGAGAVTLLDRRRGAFAAQAG